MATSHPSQRSGGPPKSWFINVMRVLLRLVFTDVVCSYVAEWTIYGLLGRKKITKPDTGMDGGLQVIICGMSRSGSTTLRIAMEILGLPCFHGMNLLKPTTCNMFKKAYKSGKKEDWDCLLKGYSAIADFPAALCYKQLMKLYPKAKVVLNIRDPHKWYKSYSLTILQQLQKMDLLCISTTLTRCIEDLIHNGKFKGKIGDECSCIQIYDLHTQEIMAHVHPSSKLLVLEFGDNMVGWAPLCEFLQLEIPQVPFPFANDRKEIQRFLDGMTSISIIVIVAYVAFLFAIIYFLINQIF